MHFRPAEEPPTPPSQHVLLAGCGDLGAAVGQLLHKAGREVTGVRRTPQAGQLPFPVIGMDLADPGAQQLPAADAVVIALTSDTHDAAGYERAYRRTLRGLAKALPELPQRVVLVSSTGVLGEHTGQVVTEETEPQPERATGQVLLAAEHDVQELFNSVTILRAAGIYGPGRTRIIKQVLNGTPLDHRRMTNRIHRDDLAAIIVRLLDAAAPPALLHAVDTQPAPLGEVAEFLAGLLEVHVPEDVGSDRPQGKTIDGAALQRFLNGDRLQFPTYREGYSDVVQSMRG
ncbi:NAD(P)H-binding protein [Nesterenkonia sphaerica]|uniref:Sugar nucleotide-binding protein n=1 Tax=Nesterenkonia sphaerica TaxID=1804988 RepID=A0A5R9AM80_9MICC|nr:NAD(P)H-binding protein [Nesterenkonia sphaerica]TLP79870.1 sugar nucleotide-binding protein [Nesterenkonia sphaerica]